MTVYLSQSFNDFYILSTCKAINKSLVSLLLFVLSLISNWFFLSCLYRKNIIAFHRYSLGQSYRTRMGIIQKRMSEYYGLSLLDNDHPKKTLCIVVTFLINQYNKCSRVLILTSPACFLMMMKYHPMGKLLCQNQNSRK